ncbi:predicted protein [Histoplasma capsulatum var. duboisii H88]|uniref:Predicted protein n=1 Tax=Ajellomyces capsulatus (strain H88) TaxID=544711 RepID=F0UEE9_AJEC8|nr:predicted protein [Histoplasma capsulatum var. duboisii H88]
MPACLPACLIISFLVQRSADPLISLEPRKRARWRRRTQRSNPADHSGRSSRLRFSRCYAYLGMRLPGTCPGLVIPLDLGPLRSWGAVGPLDVGCPTRITAPSRIWRTAAGRVSKRPMVRSLQRTWLAGSGSSGKKNIPTP